MWISLTGEKIKLTDDKDYSQPGRINWRLYKFVSNALNEVEEHIRIGGEQECPDLRTLTYQVHLYARDYKDVYQEYLSISSDLDRKYGTNSSYSIAEHIKRLQACMNALHDIGSFRLRERNPYPETREPDDYNLDVFSYDIRGIPDLPVISKLSDFYYDELRKEYENRSDHARRKEAETRAKKAYAFFLKYKEYEKNGFKKSDIEPIFGINPFQQHVIDYWLNELLPWGMSTAVFAKAGMGKSNFSSFLCQIILVMKPQWDIITDLPIIFSPLMDAKGGFDEIKINRFYFVQNMEQLLMASADIGLQNRIPAIILDEFDSALLSDQMRANAGRNLRHYIYLERHWNTQGPIFIYHARKDIPVPMREKTISHGVYMVTTYSNYLTRHTRRVVSSPDSWYRMPSGGRRYFPIPRTTLPYYSFGTSPFTVDDVDMQWLNAHVTGTQKEALRQIKDLVPKREWDKELQKEKKKEQEKAEREQKIREEKAEREQRERERRERMEQRRIDDQLKRMGKKKGSTTD